MDGIVARVRQIELNRSQNPVLGIKIFCNYTNKLNDNYATGKMVVVRLRGVPIYTCVFEGSSTWKSSERRTGPLTRRVN